MISHLFLSRPLPTAGGGWSSSVQRLSENFLPGSRRFLVLPGLRGSLEYLTLSLSTLWSYPELCCWFRWAFGCPHTRDTFSGGWLATKWPAIKWLAIKWLATKTTRWNMFVWKTADKLLKVDGTKRVDVKWLPGSFLGHTTIQADIISLPLSVWPLSVQPLSIESVFCAGSLWVPVVQLTHWDSLIHSQDLPPVELDSWKLHWS